MAECKTLTEVHKQARLAPIIPFKPSATQYRFLRTYSNPAFADLSIAKICAKIHISYSTYLTWREKSAFRSWLATEWAKVMQEIVPDLDRIGLQQGKKNFKYWEVMMVKYAGYSKVPMAQSNVVVMVKDYNDVEVSE